MNIRSLFLFCLLVLSPTPSLPAQNAPEKTGPREIRAVKIIPVEGIVSDPMLYFIRRSIREAELSGADLIVLDMKTPGGSLSSCMEIMELLGKTPIPAYSYINPDAISAGALIAIATDRIYMSPEGVIGAAAPVSGGGEDIGKTMDSKVKSVMKAKARAVAERNGYNLEVVQAFIDMDTEVKIGDKIINPKGTLLTLNAKEASEKFGPDKKPLLSAGTYATVEDLVRAVAPKAEIKRVEPSGAEHLAIWINLISPLLIMGGILGLYLEFKSPGTGIGGIIAVVCFAVYFTGLFIAGLAGYEAIVLFAIGIILIAIELVFLPGYVLPGVTGMLLVVGSLIYGGADILPSEQFTLPSWKSFEQPLINLGIALLGSILGISLLARFLPQTTLYSSLILTPPSSPNAPLPEEQLSVVAGDTGTALTTLRPSGKMRLRGELFDVVTQGEMIRAQSAVVVVRIEGTRIIVREA